ncbi:MAG TPA: copper resistance protein CopC [Bacillota bacterium]
MLHRQIARRLPFGPDACLGIFVGILVALAVASSAGAHSYIAESDPADGAQLEAAPSVIRVVFTEPIETDVSQLRLLDAAGNEVPGVEQQAAGERELQLVPATELEPGEYRIAWQTLARDGHVTSGEIRFTVLEGSGDVSPAQPAGPGGTPADEANDGDAADEVPGGADTPVQSPAQGTSSGSDSTPDGTDGAADGAAQESEAPTSRPGVLPLAIAVGAAAVLAGWWRRRWKS